MQQEHQKTFFDELMQELRRLCKEESSGTLFITTDSGHAARFALENGAIVGVAFRTKGGTDAIPFIKQIPGGTFTFSSSNILKSGAGSGNTTLPDTAGIFRLLGVHYEASSASATAQPSPQPAAQPSSQPAAQPSPQPAVPESGKSFAAKKGAAQAAAAPKPTMGKVLVVEDSAVTRKLISRVLVEGGYTVVEAENGLNAFAQLSEEKPNIMLLDVIMPGIDGYKVLSMIRKHPIFKKLPVIMLTSRDGLFDKLRGKVGGSDEYLTKPFTPEQLLGKIEKHLGR